MKKIIKLFIIIILILSTRNTMALVNSKVNNCIDFPIVNQNSDKTLYIQGWYLSNEKDTSLKVYLDDGELSDINRYSRADVYSAITGYGTEEDTPNCGYSKSIDISDLSYGTHKITIKVFDSKNNVILEENRNFIRQTPKTTSCIDYPILNQQISNIVTIQGWVMSTQSGTKVKAYVDNDEVNLTFVKRQDVYETIKGYGTEKENPNNGFKGTYDISNLSYGNHTLKIDILDSTGKVIKTLTRNFTHQAPKTTTCIDSPTTDQQLANIITIQGWVMSTQSGTKVKAYVDNNEVNLAFVKRKDVYKAIKGYGGERENPNNGFKGTYDISNSNFGNHTVKIEIYDGSNRLIKTTTRNFIYRGPKSVINIDYPKENVNSTKLELAGWYLSEAKETHVNVYLDNNQINFTASPRPDVYNIYKNLYTRNTKNPGFKNTIDVGDLSDGKHSVTVKVILSNTGQVILSQTRNFYLKKVKGKLVIDYLEQSKNNEAYYLTGWEMSTQEGSYLKTFIDNKLIDTNISRGKRDDVIKIIKDFGSSSVNPTPGYVGYINTSSVTTGKHTVKIVLYSKYNDELASSTRTINIYSKNYIRNESDQISHIQYYAPYYNQYDNRWGKIKYGLSNFGSNGCTPTSLAMAFSGILGREILPTEVGNYLYNNTNEFNKRSKGSSGMAIVYATNKYHIRRIPIKSLNELDMALAKGQIVYAAMGPGRYGTNFYNHAIIMFNYNNNNNNNNKTTYTVDPLKTSNNIWIKTADVWNERSKDPDDSRGGAFFYALESFN